MRALALAGLTALAAALAVNLARRAGAAPAPSLGGDGSSPAGAWPVTLGESAEQLGVAVRELAGYVVDAADDAVFQLVGHRVMGSDRWLTDIYKPENRPFVDAITQAEIRSGIPNGLLARLIWQESRFNPNAYNLASGATGIAQIVPRWHPGVDPWDPIASIDYAGRFLAQLYRQFGTWELALKGYNWGPGNVQRWLESGRVNPAEPLETRNYSAQILADLETAGRGLT